MFQPFFIQRDGQCLLCAAPYQKLNGSFYQDFYDQTPFKNTIFLDFKYLIKEYYDFANDPNYNHIIKYTIIFIIYYIQSILLPTQFLEANQFRLQPNFLVRITYQTTSQYNNRILYIIWAILPPRWSIYIQNRIKQSCYYIQGLISNKRVYERINHSSSLTIQSECYGPNNEPKNAYVDFIIIIQQYIIVDLIVKKMYK
ncbi:unnamed protein product [Paramecium pentaurelia]|uniref:Uncharacterized protein n=1 Tax=Paramecium pentaurelia TaxID=43138 RepID=A0A8S1Y8I5_9CILI|nr:unnamed protein product [Paramecium pentaurelia]